MNVFLGVGIRRFYLAEHQKLGNEETGLKHCFQL